VENTLQMLNYRQYTVLKKLNEKYDANNKNSDYKSNIGILGDKVYENIRYPQYTVDAIIKELHKDGYIYDLFCEGASVHTIEIKNEGKDALKYFYKDHLKIVFSKIIWMVIGSIVTLILQAIV
jgi:CTP-dependent riboflavin kinase